MVIAFILYSMLITGIIASVALLIMEKSEDNVISLTIKKEAQLFADIFVQHPEILPKRNNSFKLFITGPGYNTVLPPQISGTAKENMYEVLIGNIPYVLFRVDKPPYTLYFLYDFTEFELFEYSVFVMVLLYVFIAGLAGLLVGLYASRKAITPVVRLTDSLAQSDEKDGLAQIPNDFANDEVGVLANKFVEYNEKIRGYIEREKTFTSNASHELRTPVSVIAGAVELLEDSPTLSEADQSIVARIRNEVQGMRGLIDVLLALARGEAAESKPTQINIGELTLENLNRLMPLAKTKHIQLDYIEKADLHVKGNKHILDIILRNLLSNAVQHTENGSITVTVKNNSISIEDCGPGIPQEIRSKVFERFFSGEEKTSLTNIGIGLALVKQLCEANDWLITLQSGSNNTGTKISLHF